MRHTYIIGLVFLLVSCARHPQGENAPDTGSDSAARTGNKPDTPGNLTGPASSGNAGSSPVSVNPLVKLSEAQWKNAGIVTGRIVKKDISRILKLNGSIDVPPQNMVSVSVPLGGYLQSTNLLPGMHVARGETIAVMEDQQYIQLQQDFLTAKAHLTFAEQEYNRQKELNASKASSDKVFQQAQADYTALKVLAKSLSEKLRLAGIDPGRLNEDNLSRSVRIPSPIDGFVANVNVNIGKYVNPSDVLFEIVNPADIHLALTVFEKDLPLLSIGQRLSAYTNNDPGTRYPCEIILIGKNVARDRSVVVHCHFKKYDKTLIPGMFMNADVPVNLRQQDVLPSEAIVTYQGRQYLFVVRDERTFEMKEVRTGDAEEGYTALTGPDLDGLRGQTIVTRGAYTLLMKLKNAGGGDD